MFKFFFWRWFKAPSVGECFVHESMDGNPFGDFIVYRVLDVARGWVQYEEIYKGTVCRKGSCHLSSFLAFYKKERAK